MPDKKPPGFSAANSDEYARRLRKEVAKRRLERVVKRSEKRPASEEKTKQEEKPQKRT
jgi:hypothetical protein